MAYSTGSGDYVALWAAILAHALGDGWTEAGGLGTGFPITSPSGNTHFDYTTYTAVENNATLGAGGGTLTARYARLGLGSSAANATSNAATTTTIVPNMHWTFSEWHIFSEPTVSDHIHVVIGFSNGPNADCYGNFSFGELDKQGLTYQGISYATGDNMRGYAVDNSNGNSNAEEWNYGPRTEWGWTGYVGDPTGGRATRSNLSFMTQATTAPHPNGAGGWPAWDTVIQDGASVWAKCDGFGTVEATSSYFTWNAVPSYFQPINADVQKVTAPAVTAQITLMPKFFLMINSTGTAGSLRYMGTFPNVRRCSIKDANPGDEITFGSDTWKLFPLLRKTDPNLIHQAFLVTSGYAGIAFKKVV
ncbi:MAG TPA: hypothetical protein VIG24_15510 [Acidimicrobiia bacterium]